MKKNLLIAFSGMDGSGKTTLAKKLKKYLEKKGWRVFLKHAHGYAISQNSFGVDKNTIKRFRWIFTLLSPYILIDSWFTYLFKYKPLLKTKIVICDRYFYDKIARLLYYKIINNGLSQIYLKLLPRPNYIFFLDINPRLALKRKLGHSFKEFSNYRKIYLNIAKILNIKIIKTHILIDISFRQIINHDFK